MKDRKCYRWDDEWEPPHQIFFFKLPDKCKNKLKQTTTHKLPFFHKRLNKSQKPKIKNIIPHDDIATHTNLQLRQLHVTQKPKP